MSEVLGTLRAFWHERTVREQGLLLVLAALLIAASLWTFILRPALAFRSEARDEYARAVAAYQAFDADLVQYRRLAARAQGQTESQASLRTLIGGYARERELPISRLTPDETGRITVWIDNAPEGAVYAWLIDLAENEGVQPVRASLDREGDGRVSVNITLARGAV